MYNISALPEKIACRVRGKRFTTDTTGCSGSDILMFDDMVLKIEKTNSDSDNELRVLKWLCGRAPVVRILEFVRDEKLSYLLMSRFTDETACSEESLRHPEQTVSALADGLLTLWQIDISDCPVKNGLDEKLAAAKFNIDNNLVDMDDLNDGTLGDGGFADIYALYDFLCRNRPEQDFVFSHGDYCLPNIFIRGAKSVGFIDLGSAGIADRWQDIALCVRSLEYNFGKIGGYGADMLAAYKRLLFDKLGIEPDDEKIRYYMLLDELF